MRANDGTIGTRRVRPRATMLAVVALVAAALVVAGGCGRGDEQVEYQADLAKVGARVATAIEAMPDDRNQSMSGDEVEGLARELRESANELESLDPPDDAERAQERLVRGLRGVADGFDQLADDIHDASDQGIAADRFVRFVTDPDVDAAFDDVTGAQDEYAAAGYDVFVGGDVALPATTTPRRPG